MKLQIDTLKNLQKFQKEKSKDFIGTDDKTTFLLPLSFITEVGLLSNEIKNNVNSDIIGNLSNNLSKVLFYLIEIANKFDIDIEKAFISKQRINIERFSNNDADLINQLKENQTLKEIQETNTNIRKNWTGYNDMMLLSLAFMNEAGELMEAYLKKVHTYHKSDLPDEDKSSLKHELADCFIYLLGIANANNSNIEETYIKILESLI